MVAESFVASVHICFSASHSDTTRHMMAAVADSTSQSSTVVVRGERNVHALYNYLHECKLTHSLTGTDAGLPPTLLAPAPFEHATVQLAKVGCFCCIWENVCLNCVDYRARGEGA
jgi:hypothetical protein